MDAAMRQAATPGATEMVKIPSQQYYDEVEIMGTKKFFIAMLFFWLFCGLSNALVVSGDAGASFAKNKSAEMCPSPLVAEVYICYGNVVKVVWADAERGATFYVPDGRVINCPVVEAGKATAECIQFSIPNYCTQRVECEKKPEAEESKEQINESKPAEKPSDEKPAQTGEDETPVEKPRTDTGPVVIDYTGGPAQRTEDGAWLDNSLVLVVAVAMLAVLAIVYFAFKKTVRA